MCAGNCGSLVEFLRDLDTGTLTIGANATNTAGGPNGATSRFLNPGFANGGARVIRYQLKFVF